MSAVYRRACYDKFCFEKVLQRFEANAVYRRAWVEHTLGETWGFSDAIDLVSVLKSNVSKLVKTDEEAINLA